MIQNRINKFQILYTEKKMKEVLNKFCVAMHDQILIELGKSEINPLEATSFKERLSKLLIPREKFTIRVKVWDMFEGEMDAETYTITYKNNLFNTLFYWLFNLITILMAIINPMAGKESVFKIILNENDVEELPEDIKTKFKEYIKTIS